MRRNLELVVFVLLVLWVYSILFGPLLLNIRQTPPGTFYLYAEGFLPDYYQYLGWIKDGMMGKLFLSSRYMPEGVQPALVHPLFAAIGLTARPFNLLPHDAFLIARLLATGIFLWSLFFLIRKIFQSTADRLFALVFLATATYWWGNANSSGRVNLEGPIPWVGSFNPIYKFSIPIHHHLAIAGTVLVFIFLTAQKRTTLHLLLAVAFGVLVGFLNPSTHAILLATLMSSVPLLFLARLPHTKSMIVRIITVVVATSPVLLYHSRVFATLPPWSVMYFRMKNFLLPVVFTDYLLALGPNLILATVGAIVIIKKLTTHNSQPTTHNPQLFLISWAFVPLLLFPFAGNVLPMNHQRLFQSYQYIPLAILATHGVIAVASFFARFRISRIGLISLIGLGSVAYATVPALATVKGLFRPLPANAYNYYPPLSFLKATQFLEKNSPPESVVVTGEYMSLIIPALTHNRTVIARDDIAFDYYERRNQVFAFVDGRMNDAEARAFLTKYNVSYILSGVDTVPFEQLPNKYFPFLTEIFRDGAVSIVRVLR